MLRIEILYLTLNLQLMIGDIFFEKPYKSCRDVAIQRLYMMPIIQKNYNLMVTVADIVLPK